MPRITTLAHTVRLSRTTGPIQTCSPYFGTTALPHWLLQLWPIPPREYDPFNVKGSSVSHPFLPPFQSILSSFLQPKNLRIACNRPTLKTIVFYRRNVSRSDARVEAIAVDSQTDDFAKCNFWNYFYKTKLLNFFYY